MMNRDGGTFGGEAGTIIAMSTVRMFSSRWWGIVSTTYLVTAPFLMMGLWAAWYKPRVVEVILLVTPLLLGIGIATAIESRRSPEPPLPLFDDRVLRGLRITAGLLVPVLLAAIFELRGIFD